MVTHNRLPGGGMTTDDDHYVRAWREFAAPIGRLLRVQLYAFDPGVSFIWGGQIRDLDIAFAGKLRDVALAVEASRGALESAARYLHAPVEILGTEDSALFSTRLVSDLEAALVLIRKLPEKAL